MKPRKLIFSASILVCIVLMCVGCDLIKSIHKISSDFHNLPNTSDTIGRKVSAAILHELTKKESRLRIDSLLSSASDRAKSELPGLTDSLFNKDVIAWLSTAREKVTGEELNHDIDQIVESLLGKTKRGASEMEENLKDSFKNYLVTVLNDSVKHKIEIMRDALIGDKADTLLKRAVRDALQELVNGYRDKVHPLLKQDLNLLEKNAGWILIMVLAVALIIIGFMWWNRWRYIRLLTIVTEQIQEIEDQKLYDSLTLKINQVSTNANLDKKLNSHLSKHKLTEDDWKRRNNKIGNLN
jgi:hypothetical protein